MADPIGQFRYHPGQRREPFEKDWTVVRPPRLTNGKHTGQFRTAHNANVRRGISISRANVAAAILAVLDDPTTSRAALGVAH